MSDAPGGDEADAKVERGRRVVLAVAAYFAVLIVTNSVLSQLYSTTDRVTIQITRVVMLSLFAFLLYRGHRWVRVLVGVGGLATLVVLPVNVFVFGGTVGPHQWPFFVGWVLVGFAMFGPTGVREFQEHQRRGRR